MILFQPSKNALCFCLRYLKGSVQLRDEAENLCDHVWKWCAEHTIKNSFAIFVKLKKVLQIILCLTKSCEGIFWLMTQSIWLCIESTVQRRKREGAIEACIWKRLYTSQSTIQTKQQCKSKSDLK